MEQVTYLDCHCLQRATTPSRKHTDRGDASLLGTHCTPSIAHTLAVAKPTLYHYFPSKDETFLDIHGELICPLVERLQQRESPGPGPEQLLLEVMADILELMATHRGHVRVFLPHFRGLPPSQQETIKFKCDAYERSSSNCSGMDQSREHSARLSRDWPHWQYSGCATGRTSGTSQAGRSARERPQMSSGVTSSTGSVADPGMPLHDRHQRQGFDPRLRRNPRHAR